MNTKSAITGTIFGVFAVLMMISITGLTEAFAEDLLFYPLTGELIQNPKNDVLENNVAFYPKNTDSYKRVDDIQTIFYFEYKDGVEILEFPVFRMSNNYINKNVSPTFSVEGVVGDSPHLHKALDAAFKHKQNPSYEWNYQLAEVTVNFVKDGTIVKILQYHDCYVDDYKVKTLNDSYESYIFSNSGFVIIDDIDFQCGGLNSTAKLARSIVQIETNPTKYDSTQFTYAEDVRTLITFEFDEGIEVIEFPYFQTKAGFEVSTDNVGPGFSVEGIVQKHLLLDKAIEKARSNGGITYGVNVDFESTVEIKKGDTVLRTIEYKDCRVSAEKITTQSDLEEGFTGKSGFAYVEQIDFECIGLDTIENTYGKPKNVGQVSKTMTEKILPLHEYPISNGPRAIVTFSYDNGVEVINFPIFNQGEVIKKSNPTFELKGIVEDYPMLYKMVDDNLALTSTTGANNFLELFQVDIDLFYDDKTVRGLNYVDCRVVNYDVQTQRKGEESYFKGFALSNTFEFECLGYHPNNPIYDAMFNNYPKAKTISSTDLKRTDDWDPEFYVQ